MIEPETEAKGEGRRVEKFNKDFLGRALIKFQKLAKVRELAQAADNIFGFENFLRAKSDSHINRCTIWHNQSLQDHSRQPEKQQFNQAGP